MLNIIATTIDRRIDDLTACRAKANRHIHAAVIHIFTTLFIPHGSRDFLVSPAWATCNSKFETLVS